MAGAWMRVSLGKWNRFHCLLAARKVVTAAIRINNGAAFTAKPELHVLNDQMQE